MQVSALSVTAVQSRKHWRGQADLTVTDIGGTGGPVAGATVTGDWQLHDADGSVADLGSVSGVTDTQGATVIVSPKRRAGSGDSFLFQVTGVSLAGSDYDSGGVTSGFAEVP